MRLQELVLLALEEDAASRDVTSIAVVPTGVPARGVVLAKQDLVVSGLEVAGEVFRLVDQRLVLQPRVAEATGVAAGTVLAVIEGPALGMLSAERVALNFLQRLCGVATLTRRFVDAVAGTPARVRDTRKTTPLLRALEKRAVAAGGGLPHRSGLDAALLVKDNHVRLAGSIAEATRRARESAGGAALEVEVERLEQIEEALGAGASMLLLDNFTPETVRAAAAQVAGRVPLEVSGGVTLANVRAYAEAGADFVAVGALTHSAPAADISLELEGR